MAPNYAPWNLEHGMWNPANGSWQHYLTNRLINKSTKLEHGTRNPLPAIALATVGEPNGS